MRKKAMIPIAIYKVCLGECMVINIVSFQCTSSRGTYVRTVFPLFAKASKSPDFQLSEL